VIRGAKGLGLAHLNVNNSKGAQGCSGVRLSSFRM
jgi:hypothetical protein